MSGYLNLREFVRTTVILSSCACYVGSEPHLLTPFPGNADICVHMRTSADICVHVRSLKNRSVLGPHFLCAGAVLGSPTFQNPRAHRSNLIPSKVVVLPTRNDSFQKHMSFYLREMQVSERWMCLGMAQGPYG